MNTAIARLKARHDFIRFKEDPVTSAIIKLLSCVLRSATSNSIVTNRTEM